MAQGSGREFAEAGLSVLSGLVENQRGGEKGRWLWGWGRASTGDKGLRLKVIQCPICSEKVENRKRVWGKNRGPFFLPPEENPDLIVGTCVHFAGHTSHWQHWDNRTHTSPEPPR